MLLTAHICRVLRERMRFEVELEDHLTRRDSRNTLRVATAWGRYAELFTYDDKSGRFRYSFIGDAAG
jgi:NitT/TauT family transport system ATP-binding protein